MTRNTPQIIEWGTPPEPVPTGWAAVAAELRTRPGDWAHVGTFAPPAAKRIGKERLTADDGFETRLAPVEGDPNRVAVWARAAALGTETPEEQEARLARYSTPSRKRRAAAE